MTTIAEPVALTRSRNDHTTPAELRSLLKQTLGLNSAHVTVSKGSSNTWLTITVRDPLVDVDAVKAFAKPFDTSNVDNTDYHSGQSVDVKTTSHVDDVHAAPHLEEVRRAVEEIKSGACGCGTKLANGKYLWKSQELRGEYYVMSDLNGGPRGCYIFGYEVEAGVDWAIRALALQVARV